jgi:hypothetical protein
LVDQNPDTFLEWEITEDMVGEELILEFDHRETGAMLDAFLFIETSSGIPATNPQGPDGVGFFGPEDEVDLEFGLPNLGVDPVEPEPETSFIRGDCNGDGATADLTDAVFLLGFNFAGTDAPPCDAACDLDGDGDIASVTDAIAMLSFTFVGGAPPVAPFPACGPETAPPEAALACATPPAGCE